MPVAGWVVVVLGLIVVGLCVTVALLGKKARETANELDDFRTAARRQEATESARVKVEQAADNAVKEIRDASNADLLRIARDLARGE